MSASVASCRSALRPAHDQRPLSPRADLQLSKPERPQSVSSGFPGATTNATSTAQGFARGLLKAHLDRVVADVDGLDLVGLQSKAQFIRPEGMQRIALQRFLRHGRAD